MPRRTRSTTPTVAQVAQDYIAFAKTKNRISTVESKETLLRLHILPTLGERPIATIDTRGVHLLAARKAEEGAKPKTVSKVLSCLRRVLVHAADQGLIDVLPRFPKTTPLADKARAASEHDYRALVQSADPSTAAMIQLARAGLRLGELLGLRWSDVDFPGGTVRVQQARVRDRVGPPHRKRTVFLEDDALRDLQLHRHHRAPWVFCSERGLALSADDANRMLWEACERAELPRLGWDLLARSSSPDCDLREYVRVLDG